ncbi:helix-turn-helix domain-containing protein [Thermodesulfobacteriota bacterium]
MDCDGVIVAGIVESPLMTAKEASEYLKVSVRILHGLVRKGKLACIQYNQRVRHFTRDQLDEFILDFASSRRR